MMKNDKFNKFSVSLGLLDYINPVFYSITIITIISHMYSIMNSPFNTVMLIGAIISIIFGFIIPTGKVMVGLGLVKFKMPVSLVFCVNMGILLSGLMLLKSIFNINMTLLLIIISIILLFMMMIYFKSKKTNTIAVLIGAFGYIMLYISLITMSIRQNRIIPILLYSGAITLFIILCGIGIKANLKDPRVHWIIEITNVVCQLLVVLGTIILLIY